MLTPVRCLTCGMPLGDVAPLYRLLKAERMAEYIEKHKIQAVHLDLDPLLADEYISMSDVLYMLGIYERCCRGIMMSTMDIRDYY